MTEAEAPFIAAIRENMFAVEPRLVYADWLEERGDARADYLRKELDFSKRQASDHFPPADMPRRPLDAGAREFLRDHAQRGKELAELAQVADERWLRQVGMPMDVVLSGHSAQKLVAVKAMRSIRYVGLLSAKLLVDSAPVVAIPLTPLVDAVQQATQCESYFGPPYVLEKDADYPFFWIQRAGLLPFRVRGSNNAERLIDLVLHPLVAQKAPMHMACVRWTAASPDDLSQDFYDAGVPIEPEINTAWAEMGIEAPVGSCPPVSPENSVANARQLLNDPVVPVGLRLSRAKQKMLIKKATPLIAQGYSFALVQPAPS